MMLTISECFETGGYYATEDGIEIDYEREEAIRLKYNPEIQETY